MASCIYRLAPEHDLPTLYQDCWDALQWVASHAVVSPINIKDPWIETTSDGQSDRGKEPELIDASGLETFLCIERKTSLSSKKLALNLLKLWEKSEWKGEIEFTEVENEGHCFQCANPETEKAKDLIKRMASFIQRN
ncbi:hypothetical protein HAX54_006045 [Datura stramonium]|uniref:Alpha/beta hydrolase fold-3 domain-containing protein n=1 Tax=Datura stramonium TaxID=4076 RepID=A0ABS8RUX5_DATST|nr:hypothetical protein [Datura stramonium]